MGKTAFVLSMMENILNQNKKVLIFSLERSVQQLTKRIMIMNAQVDSTEVKLNHLEVSDFIKNQDLFIDDTAGINIEQIEEKIEEVKPDVVIIDYLQLMSENEGKDHCTQIEEIVLGLKRIAKENDVVIFVESQLSRALEERCDKRPILSDLRESGAIKNLSDVVIFLYRDDYYDISNPIANDIAEIIVAKNSNGNTGTVNLLFSRDNIKFKNVDKKYRK